MKTPESDEKRILVVEDEPAIDDLCQRVLTREGFEVDIAVNGKIARRMIEEHKYGLFLFDIKMPIMNGMELYQWLFKKYPHLAGRVIFISGSVVSGETQIFLKQIGRPFLPKPFSSAELITIVRETLRQLGKQAEN